MINIFRNYTPINIVWLAVLTLFLRIGYLANVPAKIEFVFVEPFARLLVPVNYEFALSPFVNVLLAAALMFAQALLLNTMVNYFNLTGKPSYLPGLMYITLSALFTPFLILSAPLVCNFLVILMLYKLFGLYQGGNAMASAYDLGLITALGSLIYLPFTYLLAVVLIALVTFRPFNWREWAAAILGYATVFFFLAVVYFYNDRLHTFKNIWSPLGTPFPGSISITTYNYTLLIPVAFILVLAAYRLQQHFFKSYVHIRKSYQLLLLFFVVAGLSFYVKPVFQLNHFLLCAIPAAIAFAYYFLYSTGRWFYETLYFLLLAGIVWFQFNTF
ncbi:MAG: beta-carotene 15,15'-monooxygenase [Sphingobacteriaceae bacterium]|nr:MAG: beta-carotene 15,15'-monooxygenase [Sphingobacteriaceae bacterium]